MFAYLYLPTGYYANMLCQINYFNSDFSLGCIAYRGRTAIVLDCRLLNLFTTHHMADGK